MSDFVEGFGRLDDPVKLVGNADFSQLSLSAHEGFVLSRVDGSTPAKLLCEITGLGRDITLEILKGLRNKGVIVLGNEPPVQPRTATPPKGAPARSAPSEARSSTPGQGTQTTTKAATKKPVADPTDVDESALTDEQRAALDQDEADGIDLKRDIRIKLLAIFPKLSDLTFFQLLGVSTDADGKAIRRAYFKRSKQFHPDRYYTKNCGPYKAMLAAVFKQVSAANEFLQDEEKRNQYRAMVDQEREEERIAKQLAAQMAEVEATLSSEPEAPSKPQTGPTRPWEAEVSEVIRTPAAERSRTGPSNPAVNNPASASSNPASASINPASASINPASSNPASSNPASSNPASSNPASSSSASPASDRAAEPHRAWGDSKPRTPTSIPTAPRRPSMATGPQHPSVGGSRTRLAEKLRARVAGGIPRPTGPGQPEARSDTGPTTEIPNDDPSRAKRRAADRRRRRAMTATNPALSKKRKAQTFFEQGMKQLEQGKTLAAAASLKLAMTYDESEPEYKRRYEEAVDASRSTTAEGFFKRAVFEESVGRAEAAAKLYERAATLFQKGAYLQRAAEAMIGQDDLAKAKEYATQAVQAEPNSVEARLVMARVYLAGDMKKMPGAR